MNSLNAVKRRAVAAGESVRNLATKGWRAVGATVVGGSTALVLAPSAHAAATAIDTTDIVSTISAGVTAISAIGVAVVSLVVVIKLYKWVQRVL